MVAVDQHHVGAGEIEIAGHAGDQIARVAADDGPLTGGGPVRPAAASTSRTPYRSRSSRISAPRGCSPTALTSVTSAPSRAAVIAALAAGPPAATSTDVACAFWSTPGIRSTV
jgi:hypothetical protein